MSRWLLFLAFSFVFLLLVKPRPTVAQSTGQVRDLIHRIDDSNRAVKNPQAPEDRGFCGQSAKEKSMGDLMNELGIKEAPVVEAAPAKKKEGPTYPKGMLKDLNGDGLQLTVLTEEQAQKLHSELAKYDWRLRFHIPDDGCRARAAIMSRVMRDMGITPGKIWTEPGWFSSIGDNVKNRRMLAGWKYHVAPFILVNRGGKVEPLVIDPSVSKKPLPVDDYQKMLSATPQRNYVYFSGAAPYDPSQKWERNKNSDPGDVTRAYQELEELAGRLGRGR